MYGVWQSSTRSELMALLVVTASPMAIKVGIDNKTVVEKANRIIEVVKGIEAGGTPEKGA